MPLPLPLPLAGGRRRRAVAMLSRSSLSGLAVGLFALYVAHTGWVMYGIVYTRPCPAAAAAHPACVWPYLARRPKLQVGGPGTVRNGNGAGGRGGEEEAAGRCRRLLSPPVPCPACGAGSRSPELSSPICRCCVCPCPHCPLLSSSVPAQRLHYHAVQHRRREQRGSGVERGGF